jgi:hypothetical protein
MHLPASRDQQWLASWRRGRGCTSTSLRMCVRGFRTKLSGYTILLSLPNHSFVEVYVFFSSIRLMQKIWWVVYHLHQSSCRVTPIILSTELTLEEEWWITLCIYLITVIFFGTCYISFVDCGLLDCNTIWFHKQLATFWGNAGIHLQDHMAS